MSFLAQTDELWIELARLARDEGLSLYDVERFGDNGLRVVLTRATAVSNSEEEVETGNSNRGVTSQDCSRFCRKLVVHLSVEGPKFGLGAEPQLEVSSPGINRNLRLVQHFTEAVGERVKIVSESSNLAPDDKKSCSVVGKLEQFADGVLTICEDETSEQIVIPVTEVRKARVDFRF